ncbi:MAG: type III-B CRISPR module RAMP protein Cmr4 [Candidatus Rokuibacteriota bacterium]
MARLAVPLFLYAETPLHPGTGAHLGDVDLPIQRERHTGYPIIQGSSLKGVFRALAREMTDWAADEVDRTKMVEAIFGPATDRAHEHAGAVTFTDARILLFPVRALGSVFAWTTSLDVLARLRRDLASAAVTALPAVPEVPAVDGVALVPPGSVLIAGAKAEGTIVLEEFSCSAKTAPEMGALGAWLGGRFFPDGPAYAFWRERLAKDLVVLPGDEFREFTRNATEVVTRVRLQEKTKTVVGGALWTEEHVPSESAFFVLVLVQKPRLDDRPEWTAEWVVARLRSFDGLRIQVGGDETTGRGFALVRFGGGTNE